MSTHAEMISLPRAASLLRLPLNYLLLALTNDASFPLPISAPVGLLIEWPRLVEWCEQRHRGYLASVIEAVGEEFWNPVDISWGREPLREAS